MHPAHRFRAAKVRDRAGDPQHPRIPARRQAHRFGGAGEELARGFVRRREAFEGFSVDLGIGAGLYVLVARGLEGAGGGDSGRDVFRAFGGRGKGEVGGGDGLDLDMQVDACLLYTSPSPRD